MTRNIIALVAILSWGAAFAQTPAPTAPTVTAQMPASSVTLTAGQNLVLAWNAVTQTTTGQPITSGLTYNLWEVSTGTAVLKASGLIAPTNTRSSMAVGTPCYVVTASAPGDIDSVGSSPPFCVNVISPPPQVGTPTGVTGIPQ